MVILLLEEKWVNLCSAPSLDHVTNHAPLHAFVNIPDQPRPNEILFHLENSFVSTNVSCQSE